MTKPTATPIIIEPATPGAAIFFAFLAACLCVLGAALCIPATAGCTAGLQLTPDGAKGVDTAFAVLCPLEALASPGLAGACPGEDAAFDAVVATDTASAVPAAPAAKPGPVALLRRGGPAEPPLVHIGSVPPGPSAVALQRRALALPPGPVAKPPTATPSRPTSSSQGAAPIPPVALLVDAGAGEGGR